MSTDDYKKILDLWSYVLENFVAGGLQHHIVIELNNFHQYNTVKFPAVQNLIKALQEERK